MPHITKHVPNTPVTRASPTVFPREQVHDMIGVWQVPTPFAMNFMTKTDA